MLKIEILALKSVRSWFCDKGLYDAQAAIPGFDETYRYYRDVFGNKKLSDKPETTGGAGLDIAGSYGVYWSSSLVTDYPNFAWDVDFDSDGVYRSYYDRYYGFSVRAVKDYKGLFDIFAA